MTDPAYKYIEEAIIPTVVQNLRRGAAQYGDTFRELGPAGQFSDIWRKVGPLKRALWDGETLPSESPTQICYDLIGHCLLTIYLLGEEATSE
jgi:hypothetical protein